MVHDEFVFGVYGVTVYNVTVYNVTITLLRFMGRYFWGGQAR